MHLSKIFNADFTEFGRPLPDKTKYGITSSFFTLSSSNKCLHVGFHGQQTQLSAANNEVVALSKNYKL